MSYQSVLEKAKDVDIKLSYQLFKLYPKEKTFQKVLKALEWSCHGIPWFFVVISVLFMYPKSQILGNLFAGLLLDIMVVAVSKALVRRRRPTYCGQDDQLIVVSVDKHSFPSGHASRAIYIAILMHQPGSFFSYILWLWAFAVVFSRIFLGRHHIADVLAGFLVANLVYNLQFAFGGLLNKMVLGLLVHNFVDTNDMTDGDSLSLKIDDIE